MEAVVAAGFRRLTCSSASTGVELPLYGVLSSSDGHAPRTMHSMVSTDIMLGGRAKVPHAPGCESGLQGGRTRRNVRPSCVTFARPCPKHIRAQMRLSSSATTRS
jgi:hypothetical protein